MSHVKLFALWAECFKEKYFRQKHPHDYSLCLSHVSSDSQPLFFSIFYPEHPTLYPPPDSFPDQWLFNFTPGSRARRKCSWISQSVSPLGQDSQGTWGQHLQHTCHGAAWQVPLPPPQGKGRDALHVVYHWHNSWQNKKLCPADLKLRGRTWPLGGPLIKFHC